MTSLIASLVLAAVLPTDFLDSVGVAAYWYRKDARGKGDPISEEAKPRRFPAFAVSADTFILADPGVRSKYLDKVEFWYGGKRYPAKEIARGENPDTVMIRTEKPIDGMRPLQFVKGEPAQKLTWAWRGDALNVESGSAGTNADVRISAVTRRAFHQGKKDTLLLDKERRPVALDFGNLSPVQGERFAYPDAVAKRPQLRGVQLPANRCTEDDFKTLAAWGATLARYQMTNAPHVQSGETPDQALPRYFAWLDAKLDHLDKEVLSWADKYGIDVVIDLHEPPGKRVKGSGEFRMMVEKPYCKAFLDAWRKIATRFKGRNGIYGYDLVNEPNQSKKTKVDYWTVQKLAAEEVRKIDTDTPIIIESNGMDSPRTFTYLSPLAMDNVIYEVHMYEPGDYTHQGVRGEKDFARLEYPMGDRNRDYLVKSLAAVRKFEEKHHAKIYVGEFSAAGWAPGADQYLRDCISIFKEYGWDWTYHAFREWPGWSVEHEPVKYGVADDCFKPSADNPRKRALIDGLRGK